MCGIAGFIGHKNPGKNGIKATAKAMAAALAHRGPDDEGVWSDAGDEVTLVHRRLAVIDLSPKGRQPMQSASGRYWLAFNGEIYNHLDLRARLEGEGAAPRWRGTSDTETLLAAIDAWGLRAALTESTGMFALALWDCRDKTLALARDRMGEKPLYYGEQNGVFLFASELAAITKHPAFERRMDINAVAVFMQHDCIPAPMSIYAGIKKLEPGRILEIRRRHGAYDYTEKAYWSLADAVNAGNANPHTGSETEIIDGLEARLKESVKRQMIADVPVGAFLSGGIDSSLIVALMQDSAKSRVNTYAIGFEIPAGINATDEAPHAKAVAKHLGTNHTELYITPRDMLDVIPAMPEMYGEPFADASQIPTALLARLTRRHVTVALTGDAGDELFGGYSYFPYFENVGKKIFAVPKPMRHAIAGAVGMVPWNALEVMIGYRINKFIGAGSHYGLAYKMRRLRDALTAKDKQDLFFRTHVIRWDDTDALVPGSNAEAAIPPMLDIDDATGFARTARAFDMRRFLADDILVKVDRAAMQVSLETRIPLLDHAVVEYALTIPDDMIIRGGIGKYPLRELLYRHVPRAIVDRPKVGFGPPIQGWLRGELRDWAESLLDPAKIKADGILDEKIIARTWDEYVKGRRDWTPHIWTVLMFRAWQEAAGSMR